MLKQFEYTTFANRLTAKSPMLTYVVTQINFWILANIFLVTILNFYTLMIGQAYMLPVGGRFSSMLWVSVILGILYGVSLGVAGYYLDRNVFRKISLGKVILFKSVGSLALLILILWLLRFVFFDLWIAPSLYLPRTVLNEESWRYLFWLLVVYYFFMTLVISFTNQMNRKFGPGVLVPLLLGKYRDPKEEERIFMFMDLKSSTSIAEKLGHLLYSAFIRDCFADINDVLFAFHAQVYQYVGDEIVVTWPVNEGLRNQSCIRFYFACEKQFQKRGEYYMKNYGLLPEFKAGAHMGMVTVVEIGEIKKDIAYHGDTINTSARIQSVCNEYNSDFLASTYLMEKVGCSNDIKIEALGMIMLKGKTETLGIVSVDWMQ